MRRCECDDPGACAERLAHHGYAVVSPEGVAEIKECAISIAEVATSLPVDTALPLVVLQFGRMLRLLLKYGLVR